ncbi:HigA family addiction module antitoxin [Corynebacterium sp. L4756]|uniref:HigA family addiction module antitoxin n=1 Tax=unclassified Corynebacterium TaxID=2624378 RepID=UPI00374DD8E1
MTNSFEAKLHKVDMKVDKQVPSSLRELLQEEFLDRFDMSMPELAAAIRISEDQLDEALNGSNPQLPELAQRLGRYFGTSGHFWMSIVTHHSLEVARQELGSDLYEIDPHTDTIFDDGEEYVAVAE